MIFDPLERRIVVALIDSALSAECSLSVYDGERFVLAVCRDADRILAAMGSADFDTLVVRRAGKRVGSITLHYGNGGDVVGDWSWPSGTAYEGSCLEGIVLSAERVAGASL